MFNHMGTKHAVILLLGEGWLAQCSENGAGCAANVLHGLCKHLFGGIQQVELAVTSPGLGGEHPGSSTCTGARIQNALSGFNGLIGKCAIGQIFIGGIKPQSVNSGLPARSSPVIKFGHAGRS